MKTREESNADARQFRVNEIMERIRSAVTAGNFEIKADLDYMQSDILDGLGYTVEEIGKSKREGCRFYKISWL